MMPFTKMRCAPAHRDPGGGGINVARVLRRLGIDATAIYPAGGATGQLLADLLEREGVRSIVIPAANDTREDLTIFDETTREQFRLVFPGAPLGDIEWQACLESLARITPAPAFVIASGSLPAGVPHDFFGKVAQASKAHSKVIVDTSGPFLKPALEAGVYLIKPNLGEFQELAGVASADDAALIEAGRRLFDRYRIEIIALSMGPAGALLITRDTVLRANGFPIEPISVSGAGDSFLGSDGLEPGERQQPRNGAALWRRRRIRRAAQSRDGALPPRGRSPPCLRGDRDTDRSQASLGGKAASTGQV